jgi:tRNA(fMet)-specific endonuclease VapC
MILLDTGFLIDFFKGEERTQSIVGKEVATTVITYHEIFTGLKHRKAEKEERFFKDFFSKIRIYDFDLKAAEASSEIMAKLLSSGRVVNALDVLIAGIAIANRAEHVATTDADFLELAKVVNLELYTS